MLSLRSSFTPVGVLVLASLHTATQGGVVFCALRRPPLEVAVCAAVPDTTAGIADGRGRGTDCAPTGRSGQSRRLRAALMSRSTSSPVTAQTRRLSSRVLPTSRQGCPSGLVQRWWIWLDGYQRSTTV